MSKNPSVTDLEVSRGAIEAMKGISFDVKKGEIMTLNGASKTGRSTILKTFQQNPDVMAAYPGGDEKNE